MVKALKTLIRLHKRQLDELKREQAGLEGQRDALQMMVDKLGAELQAEAAQAEQNAELAKFFGQYATKIRDRQKAIRTEIARVDKLIAEVHEKIRDGFSEMKKFEIAQSQELARRKHAADKAEQAVLDDVGIDRFGRKHKEGQP